MHPIVQLLWHSVLPALALLTGSLMAVRGLARLAAAFPHPRSRSMQPLAWMRGFRMALFGLSVAGMGAGWLWGVPWLFWLALAVGLEETIESSIAIHGLRLGAQPPPSPSTPARGGGMA